MRRQWVVAGAAGLVVALVFGIGGVLAQSGEDSAAGSFLDRVAAKLGIDSAKLEQAIDDTRGEDIDAAVASGDLTQEQADRMKERLSEEEFGEHFGGPGFGEFRGPGRGHGFAFGLHEGFDGLAEFLGIDGSQLRDELSADGATLATVAEAHGKSREELKAFLSDALTSKLDEAVAAGALTQERADEMWAMVEENLDARIDGELPGGGFKFKFKHWDDDDDGNDDGEDLEEGAEPQSGTVESEHRS